MAYRDEIVADSPYLYYRFEDSAALATKDAVSTGGQTMTVGSGVSSTAGIAGGLGIDFSGTSSYLSINFSTNYYLRATSVWTFEAWVKLDANRTAEQTIVNRSAAAGATRIGIAASNASSPFTPNALFLGTMDTGGTWVYTTGSSAVIDDTDWHHVAATSNGTTLTLYLDGVQIGTQAARSINTSGFTTAFYGAQGSANQTPLYGDMDEIAMWTSALTATRIQAHYTAGAGPAVVNTSGAFGTAAKSAGAVPTIYAAQHIVASFGVAQGSAAAPAVVGGVREEMPLTSAKYYTGSSGTLAGTGIRVGGNNSGHARLKFDMTEIPSNAVLTAATLTLIPSGMTPTTAVFTIREADTVDTNVTTSEGSNHPAMSTESVTFTGNQTSAINVTTLANLLRNKPNGGLVIYRDGSTVTEHIYAHTGADEATLYVAWTIPTINISEPFGTAAGSAAAPAVTAVARVGTTGTWTTASSTAAGTEWEASSDFIPDTTGAFGTAQATSAANIEWSYSETADFGSAAGAGSAPEVDVDVVFRVIGVFGTALGQAKAPSPLQVNPNADDYYQAIATSIGLGVGVLNYDRWYRIDEPGWNTLYAEEVWEGEFDSEGEPINIQYGQDMALVGTFHRNVQGPEGRAALHIASGYAYDPSGNVTAESDDLWTQEMVIRTNKKTGMLWYGSSSRGITYVELVNGRIRVANFLPGTTVNAPAEFTGRLDVADNSWHHIVVQRVVGGYLEIYVDGQLDIRRLRALAMNPDGSAGIGTAVPFYSAPDYYFGAPMLSLPRFTGDVMEMVSRFGHTLNRKRVRQHSNAVFGIHNNFFNTAAGSASGGDWVAKGNIPLALALHFAGTAQEDPLAGGVTGLDWEDAPYDFSPKIPVGTKRYGNYQLEWLDVTGVQFFDEVTGEGRFRNLDTEADLSKYDMVFFPWYPDESNEASTYWYTDNVQVSNSRKRLLEMLETLRTAIDKHGTSMLVTNPQLAADLGIVDRVEHVPSMEELSGFQDQRQGNAEPAYGPHANDIDPWAKTSIALGADRSSLKNPDNPELSMDYYYWDSHHNNRFRVRNLVEGLTDNPVYILEDVHEYLPHRQFTPTVQSRKYLDRTENGLHLGDEFVFDGPRNTGDKYPGPAYSNNDADRVFGTYATPIANVKAGSVVTSYGDKVWQGRTQVTNPYRNYATSIAVRPGEMLNGKPLGGKIFVSFTEKVYLADRPAPVIFQVVPESENETVEQKKWQHSGNRMVTTKTEGTAGGGGGLAIDTGTTSGPAPGRGPSGSGDDTFSPAVRAEFKNGQFIYRETGSNLKVFMVTVTEKFPTERKGALANMILLGMLWLADRVQVAPGQVVANWAPAKGAAAASPVTSQVGVIARSTWSTARGVANANVGASPSTRGFFGTAQARGSADLSIAIRFGTAKATARADIKHSYRFDATEVITLYVETGQVTLYLEEE